jgi:hypothetical protein
LISAVGLWLAIISYNLACQLQCLIILIKAIQMIAHLQQLVELQACLKHLQCFKIVARLHAS